MEPEGDAQEPVRFVALTRSPSPKPAIHDATLTETHLASKTRTPSDR